MSWDEYCSLVQSKPLALNIVSFRDQSISQGGESGRNRRTLSYYKRPSQVLLSNFVYQNTPLTSVNPVAATNMNSAAAYVMNNASNYRQTQVDSSSIFPPRSSSSSSSSSSYMNIPRISCGEGSCCAQGEWRGGGGGGGVGGGVAANSSHYQLSTQRPYHMSSIATTDRDQQCQPNSTNEWQLSNFWFRQLVHDCWRSIFNVIRCPKQLVISAHVQSRQFGRPKCECLWWLHCRRRHERLWWGEGGR